MGKGILGLALIAALFIAFTAFDPTEQDRRADAAHYAAQQSQIALERDRLQLDLQRSAADRAEWQAANLRPVWLIAAGLLIVLGVVTAGACVGVALDSYRMRRVPLVRPDAAGVYPLARPALVEGTYDPLVQQVAILAQQVRALAATHQPGQTPAALTYSPHIATTRHDAPALLPDSGLVEAEVIEGGTFAELLDRGQIGRGNPLHLGFSVETHKALIGSWLDLYSTAVAGMSGTGKTTSQRFLAAQCALHGARFAVVDPHAGAADDSLAATLAPLSSIYLCEPASADRAILEVVRLIADVGQRRVSGKDSDRYPLILWVDELTSLLGRSSVADDLGQLLERIAQEFRKVSVFACCSGQIWTASRATSELRDSFASVLCHRMKRGQARLLLPTDEAETVERLPVGQAVLWRTSGEAEQVIIPNCTATDLRRVGGMLATERHTDMPQSSQVVAILKPEDMPFGSQVVAETEWLPRAAASHSPTSAEAARALALFQGGMDLSALVWELRQVKSSQGGKYQAALGEVQALLRQALAGR